IPGQPGSRSPVVCVRFRVLEYHALTDVADESGLRKRGGRVEDLNSLGVGLVPDRSYVGQRVKFLQIGVATHTGELVADTQIHGQAGMNLPGILRETIVCRAVLREGTESHTADRNVTREEITDKSIQGRPLKVAASPREKVSGGDDRPALGAKL